MLCDKYEMNEKEYSQSQGLTVQFVSVELYKDTNSYDCDDVLYNIKKWCIDHQSQYVIMFHDKDVFTENTFRNHVLIGKKGEAKKPHYHCLISLPYRRHLSDLSIAFGVEDRWIKKLKKEYDFDNMIVYLTHIRCPEKAFYQPEKYDTNIKEYCEYLYNKALEDIDENNYDIVSYLIHLLSAADYRITYQMMYRWLKDRYSLKDIQKSYKILSDIMIEHNRQYEVQTINERLADKNKMIQQENAELRKNLDVTLTENMKLRGISIEDNEKIFDEEE